MKTFKQWLENIDATKMGIRDVLLTFFKTELHINDEDTILNMRITDMAPGIAEKLKARGIVGQQPEAFDMIRNGATVQELIDTLTKNA